MLKPNYIGIICTKFNKYQVWFFYWYKQKTEVIVSGDNGQLVWNLGGQQDERCVRKKYRKQTIWLAFP